MSQTATLQNPAHIAAPIQPAEPSFQHRHNAPSPDDIAAMLRTLGLNSLDQLADATVPPAIRLQRPLDLPPARSERAALADLHAIASRNHVYRSFIGMGYHDTFTPPVIQRCILENPGWYTAYTPYQAEIAQGRLEALLNFQTMIIDLTGLEVANASLLDEATAAAEAMTMAHSASQKNANRFLVSHLCHPQTIDVVRTRAEPLGLAVEVSDHTSWTFNDSVFGCLLQYPATDGRILDYAALCSRAHAADALVCMATDPLSLLLLASPASIGADIAIGTTQRFGVPLGFGGPHAAFLATKDAYKRLIPGRIVGVSIDNAGKPALRLALQTREQHIRRDRATSNICTAQVLLAVISVMYAVYHGPRGLRNIAQRVRHLTADLAARLHNAGFTLHDQPLFDTLTIGLPPGHSAQAVHARAADARINLRPVDDNTVALSIDECTTPADIDQLARIIAGRDLPPPSTAELNHRLQLPPSLTRTDPLLTAPVFNRYHAEHEMLRYLHRLEAKDLALNTSMIPLGSCTMKLNAAAEMLPISWPGFARIHPFAPDSQTAGYRQLFNDLQTWLAEITGFDAVSLQPNAGSAGEYAGLLAICGYHKARGDHHRNICLIPLSAHGTNPASAVMAGLEVVPVSCDHDGNIDLADLKSKAEQHAPNLAAIMVTYPSTHGVFEEAITEVCKIVHNAGGQVYMDGANMNAQVGLCRPADFGADVCHLNLHKTFCIPHGGGGPGMGPIGVRAHLAPFLAGHPVVPPDGKTASGAISAAPWGSASILPISWMYIAMMGADGLTNATKLAILNANYIAKRLEGAFNVLYKGRNGLVAHECILDLRSFKRTCGIDVTDVAKRLMDYGFHAPTVSWPVAETLMVEPTESESKAELDRFCDAMISIRKEIADVEAKRITPEQSPLRNAPHTAETVTADHWNRPYSRQTAAYPAPWLAEHKYWPTVGRIDAVHGDRHFICSCEGMEKYATTRAQ